MKDENKNSIDAMIRQRGNEISNKRILLLKILPGLGKSYLGKNHDEFIDYEDWIESKGLKYKERSGDDVLEDLASMIAENEILLPGQDIYITSSIAWEDFNTNMLHSILYVCMAEGEYNCEEVKLRNRADLCEKFGARLIEWNNAYGSMKSQNQWPFVEYMLHSEEMLNKDRIVEILSNEKGYRPL